MEIKKFSLCSHGDCRGQLIAIEELKDIPFDIKRVYYMYDTTIDAIRGKHAHKTLKQVLICTSGSCKIMVNDGNIKEIVELSRPDEALFIGSSVWREMFDFSKNAVLMVLASDYYNENDYIRNYDEFLKFVNSK